MPENDTATLEIRPWEDVLELAHKFYDESKTTDSTELDESAIAIGKAIYTTLCYEPGEISPPERSILINQVASEELEAINGIGPAKASDIIEARPIQDLDALKALAGGVDWDAYNLDFSS